jgi:hypothetical protein
MTQLASQSANGQISIGLLAELEKAGAVVNNGLELPPDLPYDRYEAIGNLLGHAHNMVEWLIADWLAYGEHTYGQKYAQASLIVNRSENTLQNYNSLATRVPPSLRRPMVSFSTHMEVKGLPAREIRRVLKRAEDERLSKLEVRQLVRGEEPQYQSVEREICESCGRPLP